jgi:hypothetical protein
MPNHKPKTPADLLEEVGRALTGNAPNWQMTLSVLLNVRRDSVRDWRSGRNPIRPQVWADLLSLIVEQRSELGRVEQEVRELLSRQPPTNGDKP